MEEINIFLDNKIDTYYLSLFDNFFKDENYFRLDSTSVGYALKTKSIIVNLNNIPVQPINFLASDQENFVEDDLIAYAWSQFLERGA